MSNLMRNILAILFVGANVSAFAGEKQSPEIGLLEPTDGARVGCTNAVRIAWRCAHPAGKGCKGVYAVEVMKRRDGRVHFAAEDLKTNAVELTGLDVGEEYTWSVWCGKRIRGGRFFTVGEGALPSVKGCKPVNAEGLPKWHAAKGVDNLRDIGGWTGLDGRKVKLGRLYRSAALEKVTDKGRDYMVKVLGIRTDLDLRTPEVVAHLKGKSPLGVGYSNQSSNCYGGFAGKKGKQNFAETFRWFLNSAEYPVVFHCAKGADRTGSWAFLLNGLLGVSEPDLRQDWEMTQNWNSNPLFKHRTRYCSLVKMVNGYEGNTFTDKVVAYAKSCGITDEEIAKWRKMMLE